MLVTKPELSLHAASNYYEQFGPSDSAGTMEELRAAFPRISIKADLASH